MSDRLHAPELDGGLTWLGSGRPITLAELRGHVVLLDFWTYCCINCLHSLPVLRKLEERFADRPFIVIGVHSAKFPTEKDPENVARAMARYDLRHPVVVDSEHRIWSAYTVKSWPTLVLLDAEGRIAHQESGEPDATELGDRVAALLEESRAAGTLTKQKVALPGPAPEAAGTLRFPAKIRAAEGRLFIADTGHHRVLVAAPDGLILERIGSGQVGDQDGGFAEASFHSPHGMTLLGRTLFVADTGNHRVRAVDLDARTVRTVAGSGERGGPRGQRSPDPRAVALRSPWDVCEVGDGLLIAMAGSHQIWALEPDRGLLGPYAGTGQESHVDGPTGKAAFAQPSGLCRAAQYVFVADSETSSVRVIDIVQGEVMTVCGEGLFDWGDRDGEVAQARLQHAMDVAFDAGALYVADSYNHKIKRVHLEQGLVETVCGDGTTKVLHEPAGVCVWEGRLYIADTNAHRIRVLDLERPGAPLETLELRD